MKLLARAPNHLGDGIMALPALEALARLGVLTIQSPGWGAAIYRDVDAEVIPRGPAPPGMDAAVLFPPSFRVAWQARRVPRRVGVAADGRRLLLTDVVARAAHRARTYAALAEALGATVEGSPRWTPRPDDPVPEVPDRHVALFVVSASGPTVDWPGFSALAERIAGPVVAYGGPGQGDAVRERVPGVLALSELSLPALAGAWQRAAVVVSNDTGPAHFARALGRPTVVIHGSTTATVTGPAGALPVEGPALDCRPCYRKRCPYALGCLDIPVERVLARVRELTGG